MIVQGGCPKLSVLDKHPRSLSNILSRGFIWSIKGVIFGFVFLLLHEFIRDLLPPQWAYLYAAAFTGALSSLIYSSMRLTLIASIYTFVTLIGIFLVAGSPVAPSFLMLGGGLTGLVVGTLYGSRVKGSRICRAEAKAIAGAFSGALASGMVIVPYLFLGSFSYPLLTTVLFPATALTYIATSTWFVRHCHRLLPASLDGALVGTGVGAILGAGFWIMTKTIEPAVVSQHQIYISHIVSFWPLAVSGAAAAGFFAGVYRSLVGAAWLDI